MLVVRFPNGQTIQYNTATYLTRGQTDWTLYTREGGEWIASIQVSAGVIVESVPACRVYKAIDEKVNEELLKELRSIKRKLANNKERR